ncbi:hypothetical protein NDU88_001993 [Pleurodeles waltl]|uniref:Uncharacterized protein n=1 Tax=Pleurodeles waltl TaxID=8319 RepID=A0AAV7MRH5_PLEWA|nr:hypothetical protein NDU88_001993 [Pleurodeles waltl]
MAPGEAGPVELGCTLRGWQLHASTLALCRDLNLGQAKRPESGSPSRPVIRGGQPVSVRRPGGSWSVGRPALAGPEGYGLPRHRGAA